MALVLAAGCASSRGFDRGALRERLQAEAVEIDDAEIEAALALRPQVALPLRLAVYLHDVAANTDRSGTSRRGWAGPDKDQLLAWGEALKADGVLADMFIMSGATVAGGDLRAIRLAAARHGADAVLVLAGAGELRRSSTAFAALNWTIIGGLVLPGTRVEALFLVDGTVWDVRNEYLYLSAEADGSARRVGPTFLLDQEPTFESARRRALEAFGQEFLKRARALKRS